MSNSAKSPTELFSDWLISRSNDTRAAVVIDSDRFLADAGVLSKPVFHDPSGRDWQLAVFRGDDLAFRLSFRKASGKGRTLIVLSLGPDANAKIEVSYVSDILARNEAGPPLDLSLTALLGRLCPKITFPLGELRRFRTDLLNRLDFVPAAAEKVIERWGKPDSWGRAQVVVLVLLTYHPELSLADIWPDETSPDQFIAHAIRLMVAIPQLRPHREIVLQLIHEAARPQVCDHLDWLEVAPEELAGYLVLRQFATQAKLQNPATQLAGLHIFSPETPLAKMESIVSRVIAALQANGKTWAAVEQVSESFLTPKRMQSVLDLIPPITGGGTDASSLLSQRSAVILSEQLGQVLQSFFASPSADQLAWTSALADHPLLIDAGDNLTEAARRCRAALQVLLGLRKVEERLALPLPKFPHADALLDWYVSHGLHFMELDVAQVFHQLQECGDESPVSEGQHYLFGGADDLGPSDESLKGRVRSRLHALDKLLAEFVRQSPEKFGLGSRSIRGFLKEKIDVAGIQAGAMAGRVWVLIFDGMRLDTWQGVVQPLLAEHFSIEVQAYFCLLPSYTEIARTGLLAGGLPKEWKSYKGAFIKDEAQLFAINMGLTAQEAKEKVRFVTEADTMKARMKLGFADKDAAPLNVLIYPISDDCHEFRGDLAAFNGKIRAEIMGDKARGLRGILDDLLKRIHPEDTVLLTSDHGFIELLAGDAVQVSDAECKKAGRSLAEDVRWRYCQGFRPTQAPDSVEVNAGEDQVFMVVGRRWFKREGTKILPRYTHGGLSLAETVIPGAVLSRVTEKEARVELEKLPTILSLEEDATSALPVAVRNAGNCEVEFSLHVQTNLGEELLAHNGRLAAGDRFSTECMVTGKYAETAAREINPAGTVTGVTVRLRHTDLQGNWRQALDGQVTIPVKIAVKQTKLGTDALKNFDEI
jgi:hypothetical protein